MKIKRIILYLIFVFAFSLQACGPKEEEGDRNGNKEEQIKESGDEQKEQDTNTDKTTEEQKDTKEQEDTGEKTAASAEVTIEEQVLYDQDNIKITATSLSMDEFLGPEIKLLLENSSEVDVTVQAREVSINDYMIEPTMSSDVAAGKKANDSLSFFTEELENNSIDKIAKVEFRFSIFNTETFDEIALTDTITINTSAKDTYVQTYDDSGDVIYENKDIKIIDKGIASDELFGPEIRVYIENNTAKNITVQAQNVSVNGFMVEPIFSSEVAPGKKRNDGITFLDLEESDIEKISEVELTFTIFDTNSFDTIDESEVIKLKYE